MSCYHHLTIEERENILVFLSQGLGVRQIAKELKRSPSTISREISRNGKKYRAQRAQKAYEKRRKRSVRKRVLDDPELHRMVHFFLGSCYWSPEQIANRLEYEGKKCIGTSTIYRALENGLLQDTLRYYLRFKYKKLGKCSNKPRKCFSRLIDERPQEAADRAAFGHWEGDTVYGHCETTRIITLVDRKSRYLLTGKVDTKETKNVNRVIINLLVKTQKPVKSITFDQGTEFADSATLETALKTNVYFAHPHSPWERPSNENTNGLLRQFVPKRTKLAPLDKQDIASFTARLNLRPRKCLGWKTPYEVFFDKVLHLT